MKAAYATNVGHYDHVLYAMNSIFDEVTLIRRPEPTPRQVKFLESVHAPKRVLTMLNRRAREPIKVPHSVKLLGLGDLALTAAVQSGRRLSPDMFRRATEYSAKRVAKFTAGDNVLHFLEGLGHQALRRGHYFASICERRAMHHAVFEGDFPSIGSFPHVARTDPIGELLDFEYEASTKILVYSQAAKRSFLERGFDEDKLLVAPIGVPRQLPVTALPRDSYKIAFVGRGDVYKGLDLAVAAVGKLGSPYKLHVAGPMRNEVLNWLKFHPQVVYEGLLNKIQLRELYSTSAIMVLPSIEAFGLAVAEAYHHGLHVLCMPETGISEYLPQDACTLVSGRDPDYWAFRIRELTQMEGDLMRPVPDESVRTAAISWAEATKRLADAYSLLV